MSMQLYGHYASHSPQDTHEIIYALTFHACVLISLKTTLTVNTILLSLIVLFAQIYSLIYIPLHWVNVYKSPFCLQSAQSLLTVSLYLLLLKPQVFHLG